MREGASPTPALGDCRESERDILPQPHHQSYTAPFSNLDCLFRQGLKPEHGHEGLRPAVGISSRSQPTSASPREDGIPFEATQWTWGPLPKDSLCRLSMACPTVSVASPVTASPGYTRQ